MTEYRFKARPTIYNGIRMRSRLEARFAGALDGAIRPGATWHYEANAYADQGGDYLPDFVLRAGEAMAAIDVKPTVDHVRALMESGRMTTVFSSEPRALIVACCPAAPGVNWYSMLGFRNANQLAPSGAGLLIEVLRSALDTPVMR